MHWTGRLARLGIAPLLALLCTTAIAGTTHSFSFHAESYPGSRDRQYKVYVPEDLAAPAPLVMALHGCQQTNDDVLRDWGLTAAAERHGFVLVAPFITSYDGLRNPNCWGFWFDGHRHEGRGEPEDLRRIAQAVETRFAVDPARRYITGLSSGGAMAAVAATTHNEYWAAAAVAAALPYGEDAASVSLSGRCPGTATFHSVTRVAADMRAELDDPFPIPLMVLQNERDCSVVQPAGHNLRDAQLRVFGRPPYDTPAGARAVRRPCSPVSGGDDYGCLHTLYTADGTAASRSLVETVFYNGPLATPNPNDTDHGHYWIGGAEGNEGRWSTRDGPVYPEIVWDFFARHPRDASAPPAGQPRITLIGPDPLRVELGSSFVDPGASVEDGEDGALAVSADCSAVDPGHAGRYSCTYRATDSDGHSAVALRTVEVIDSAAPQPSCTVVRAAPASHILAGRAVNGGWFGLRALATGDAADIGYAWDFWFTVTLYEGLPGQWYAWVPAACRE
ncbi:PHB depolymerase family esterase [Sedimenticola hydrogenitrophicus]|uniref:extracellular catalytic domain type 1 short-chain-length polyhydroxyalkanoate depolymerase n=1 Tax=Sedimenticola hydrogenitrophicus TaxID=2967975 RepID=UPI0023AF5E3E|nr:PHB depolymerase family esterase [Sedimenticola hydrogenitrophicus]